jgi:glycerol-3-phosphate dehydrogenase (NAD(P)+)
MARVTVVGAGMMGTAICTPLLDNGHEVRLVGTHLDGASVALLQSERRHPGLEYPLHDSLTTLDVTGLPEVVADAEVLVLGVSSPGVRWAAEKVGPHLAPGVPIISVTKGFEWDGRDLKILPDVLASGLPGGLCVPAAIAGPCIAGELAGRVQTAVVFTGRDAALLPGLQSLFATDYYHIEVSSDAVGVEVCAALKNAYAMAVGFAAGLHEARGGAPGKVAMHNYEAAVFAQAAKEMAELVVALGGRVGSAMGLAGVGDLLVTCNGGRTSRLGRWFGRGLRRDDAIAAMQGATLESVDVLRVLDEAVAVFTGDGRLRRESLPLLRHLCDVVVRDVPVDVPFASFLRTDA